MKIYPYMKKILLALAWTTSLISCADAAPADAVTQADLKALIERINRLEAENKAQAKRIAELEGRVLSDKAATGAVLPNEAATNEMEIAKDEDTHVSESGRIWTTGNGKKFLLADSTANLFQPLTAQGLTFTPYGYITFEAIHNTHKTDVDAYTDWLRPRGNGGKNGDNSYKVTSRITGGENASGEGSLTCFNWGNTGSAGSLTLALHPNYLDETAQKTLKDSILATADEYLKQEEKQGYGIPYTYDGPGYTDPNNLNPKIVINGYEWGSNSMVINNLIAMAYAYDLTGDAKYLSGVTTGMDYLLGTNPLAFSFITGYGSYCENNPHHRYWSHELDKSLPEAPDGILSGGPNAGLQDPYVRALGFVPGNKDNPSQRCYVDSIEAWSTNEVTINWNAPLAWIVEFLQDKDNIKELPQGGSDGPDEPKKDTDWGNVNESDGSTPEARVDVSDAVLLARFCAEDTKATITAQGKKNADVNASGAPDKNDTIKILKFIAKIIPYEDLGKAD